MLDSRGRVKTCCSSWLLSTMPASWSISRVVKALISLQGPMAMSRWGGGCFRKSVFLLGLLSGCSDGQWTVRVALYVIREMEKALMAWIVLIFQGKVNNSLMGEKTTSYNPYNLCLGNHCTQYLLLLWMSFFPNSSVSPLRTVLVAPQRLASLASLTLSAVWLASDSTMAFSRSFH